MNIAELSVKRPVFISCLFLATLGLGILALSRLSSSLYPDVTFPVINIIVPYPGASPNEIQEQVSKPIESELSSLAGLRLVRSLSLDGAAVVTAVFTMDTDIRFTEPKVLQAMTRVRPHLPSGILDPSIRSVDPSETPVATLSLAADIPESELFDLADREIRPLLEQIPEVGQATIVGARKREIQVDLDLEKLRQRQMSASEVVGRLSAAGLNVPAGQVEVREHEFLVRSIGEFDSLDALRNAPIRSVDRQPVTVLGDVATVTDGLEQEKTRVSIDGKKAMVIRVFRRSGANAVDASNHIRASLKEIAQNMGEKTKGFKIEMLRDGAKPVREGIGDATDAILLGLVLTIGVVFFFLGNIRSTVITGLSLPNSILGAFFLMWIAGFSINITTLAALALAVGLLIDDAIVVRENIYRRMEAGEYAQEAAINGTREVTLAVVATTLTVLAVFGPVSFLQGLIGQFFKQFGLTICFAMLVSLLDSLTLAPMLSAYFGHAQEQHGNISLTQRIVAPFNRLQSFLQRIYMKLLGFSLRAPLRVLGLALVICAFSILILQFIPKAFVPSQESGEFQVVVELPAGVNLDSTDQKIKTIADRIRQHPEVLRVVATAGGELGELNTGQILVVLKDSNERRIGTNAVKELVRKDLMSVPDVTIRLEDLLDIGGGAGHPYTLKITGENSDGIRSVAKQLSEKLALDSDLKDVATSYHAGAQEIRWTLDADHAKKWGVSSGEMGYELRLLVAGARPAHLHEQGHDYEIFVHHQVGSVAQESDSKNLIHSSTDKFGDSTQNQSTEKFFSSVQIPTLTHRLLPLTAVATKTSIESPASILREDRKPMIEVTAELNPAGKGLSAALQETRRIFDSGEVKLPAGVSYDFSGQTKDFQDLLRNVILAGILAVAAMYLVLASLYDSFFVPLSIMLVLPLAICGAFYGLWITRSTLDIYSMIGCILLMGVAAKNSILLVDSIQAGVRAGQNLGQAIQHAGQVRFRPILMTSFALIAGMLPLALPLQESAKGRAPMAIAVIGGVISSTLLTLVVVPAAYGFILRFENWTRHHVDRWLRPTR